MIIFIDPKAIANYLHDIIKSEVEHDLKIQKQRESILWLLEWLQNRRLHSYNVSHKKHNIFIFINSSLRISNVLLFLIQRALCCLLFHYERYAFQKKRTKKSVYFIWKMLTESTHFICFIITYQKKHCQAYICFLIIFNYIFILKF